MTVSGGEEEGSGKLQEEKHLNRAGFCPCVKGRGESPGKGLIPSKPQAIRKDGRSLGTAGAAVQQRPGLPLIPPGLPCSQDNARSDLLAVGEPVLQCLSQLHQQECGFPHVSQVGDLK